MVESGSCCSNGLDEQSPATLQSKCMGFLFTATSGVCFACASLFVKLSGSDVPVPLIIFMRSMLQIVVSVLLNAAFWKQSLYPKHNKGLLVGFGILCFLTIYGIYFSFKTIPLGEATVIISTCPFFVAILERLFLKISVSITNLLAGLTCCVGVMILTHSGVKVAGETSGMYLLGYCIITLSTLTQAMSFVLVKHLNIHFVVPVFYLGVSNMILSSLLCLPLLSELEKSSITPTQGSWLLLVSVFAVAGSFTLNKGLEHDQAALQVALVRNVDIVIAYIFDVVIFRHNFSPYSFIGSFLVLTATIGSGLFNVLHEQTHHCQECDTDHSTCDTGLLTQPT